MFTGLVEEVGILRDPRPLGNGRAFRIEARTVLDDLRPGDSIAVDGVCLTATTVGEDGFEVQAVATTLERTTLGGAHASLCEGQQIGSRRGRCGRRSVQHGAFPAEISRGP